MTPYQMINSQRLINKLIAVILVSLCIILIVSPSRVSSLGTINIWKHRYPFYGGYGYGFPYGGGYGGYGGIHLGGYGGWGR